MHTLRYLSVVLYVFLLKSRLKLALPPVMTLMSLYPLFVTMYFKFTSRCNVISREVNKYTTQSGTPIWKRFFKKFPCFPEKLTLCAKLRQKWSCWDFEMLPPDYITIKILVLFHKSTYQTLPFSLKIISGKFPSFQEKLTLCAKLEQKWSCLDFEVLPPDYVTINQF